MVEIDVTLVERLVASQFPQWAGLSIRPVANGGWNNRTFHLGDTLSVRLPSAERYVAQVGKEIAVLPRLAPHLPFAIPCPAALGEPGEGFEWPWAIYHWIDGETAERHRIADMTAFAVDLARFMIALWSIDTRDGPAAGQHNFFRGGNLSVYDDEARRAMDLLADEIDLPLLREIWDVALDSVWTEPPVWLHGDVSSGNLLVRDGKLAAVIDFGTCATGDPACDLVIAWTLMDAPAAAAFREKLGRDDDCWGRARGWCLWKALIKIVELRHTDLREADVYREWIRRVSADHLDSPFSTEVSGRGQAVR